VASRTRPDCCLPSVAPAAELSAGARAGIAAACRALGDSTRLEIFRLIAAQPAPICACDVVGRFDLSQPTVSHHLRVLADAGMVRATRRGVWAYYEPLPLGLALLAACLAAVRDTETTNAQEKEGVTP